MALNFTRFSIFQTKKGKDVRTFLKKFSFRQKQEFRISLENDKGFLCVNPRISPKHSLNNFSASQQIRANKAIMTYSRFSLAPGG